MIANPFPGLRPFDFEDNKLFFGRDQQSEELLVRLGRKRLVAVVGASGSGKFSLVRAGVLPALLGGSAARVRAMVLRLAAAEKRPDRRSPESVRRSAVTPPVAVVPPLEAEV